MNLYNKTTIILKSSTLIQIYTKSKSYVSLKLGCYGFYYYKHTSYLELILFHLIFFNIYISYDITSLLISSPNPHKKGLYIYKFTHLIWSIISCSMCCPIHTMPFRFSCVIVFGIYRPPDIYYFWFFVFFILLLGILSFKKNIFIVYI